MRDEARRPDQVVDLSVDVAASSDPAPNAIDAALHVTTDSCGWGCDARQTTPNKAISISKLEACES
jgi:hypothetical protein